VADGAMSAYWFGEAKVNDLLRLEGPLGTFIFRQPERCVGRDIAMLATGTGFAPIKAMLEQLAGYENFFERNRVTVIWGGRLPEDIYLPMEGLGSVAFEAVLSGGRSGAPKRYVQHALLDRVPDLGNLSVFACGSDAMIRSARDFLTTNGLSPDRYHYESFVSSETSTAGST
jgi:CDP-4-dehydro-6-deoxyglucose reductase